MFKGWWEGKRKPKSPKCNTTTDYGGIGTVDGAAFHGDFNAWSNPDPKRDFMLSIAFAIQKGNVRMLQRCASRRARSCRRGSYSSRLPVAGA